jgi:hypothetical protein
MRCPPPRDIDPTVRQRSTDTYRLPARLNPAFSKNAGEPFLFSHIQASLAHEAGLPHLEEPPRSAPNVARDGRPHSGAHHRVCPRSGIGGYAPAVTARRWMPGVNLHGARRSGAGASGAADGGGPPVPLSCTARGPSAAAFRVAGVPVPPSITQL